MQQEHLRELLRPQRAEGETFEQYKARRKAANIYVKKSGTTVVWDSYALGTFVKDK